MITPFKKETQYQTAHKAEETYSVLRTNNPLALKLKGGTTPPQGVEGSEQIHRPTGFMGPF